MITITGKKFVYFDVDDTLVSWAYPSVYLPIDGFMSFHDPLGGFDVMLLPIDKTIVDLKRLKAEGCTIIVWSAGGWEWAECVVKTLKLEEYVDCVMSKPSYYYDDIPCTEFMGQRIDYSKDYK